MALIDFILNLAGVLLWFSWRSLSFDPIATAVPTTLAGTLRRAEPRRERRWQYLGGLAALLFFRAWLYWQIGSSVYWVPSIKFGAIAIFFRSDMFVRICLFSALSFCLVLGVSYFWLLLLSIV